jgi:hypothetical protein
LSKEDKEILLIDLKQKRIDLKTLLPKPENSCEDYRFRRIDFIIDGITKGIEDDIE